MFSMTYFNNNTQVAMFGDFYGFQQNPSVTLTQAAACTADGKSCYPLGQGLDVAFGSGSILNLGNMLYASYITRGTGFGVSSFDTTSINANQPWKNIYAVNETSGNQISM